MGLLALAGALSGAGNAGTQALSTAQVGLQNAQIQAERDKMENERLKMHMEHTENLQKQNQTFLSGERQKQHWNALEVADLTAQASSAEKEKDRMVEIEKLGNQKRHYENVEKALAARLARPGKDQPDLATSDLESLKILDTELKSLLKRRYESPIQPTPDEIIQLDKRIEDVKQEAMTIAKHGRPPVPAKGAFFNRFPAAGDSAGTATAAVPSGTPPATVAAPPSPRMPQETQGVERMRPVMPRGGRPEPGMLNKISKGQIDYDLQDAYTALEHQKKHGNKAAIQSAQQRVDELEAQQRALQGR